MGITWSKKNHNLRGHSLTVQYCVAKWILLLYLEEEGSKSWSESSKEMKGLGSRATKLKIHFALVVKQ